jgi:hypothetical protein
MKSKKAWLIWALFSILLTSCEEIHGYITFEKNGSGVLSLKVVYPEGSNVKSVEKCREYLPNGQWDDVSYEGSSSVSNPSSGDQCTFTYSFNDLGQVDKQYRALGIKLDRLSIDDNQFTYQAVDKTCVKDFDPKVTKSVTWSVKPPGTVTSHNADKVIGDTLTWNMLGFDCYDISAVSSLTKPTDQATDDKGSAASSKSPDDKTESQPLDESVVTWTTVGASIATMIATAIAYKEFKKKK